MICSAPRELGSCSGKIRVFIWGDRDGLNATHVSCDKHAIDQISYWNMLKEPFVELSDDEVLAAEIHLS